jgi:hypothetical protein
MMAIRRNIALPLLALAGALVAASGAAADPVAPRVDTRGPFLDPMAALWADAPAIAVDLFPQTMAQPYHFDAAVDQVEMRVVHNGTWIGVRLEWADEKRDVIFTTDTFGDQAAIQFPVEPDPLPLPMMGDEENAVNILQWRAAFQRDLEEGDLDIRDLYPNALIDVYPDQVLGVVDQRAYTGALGVDNPVARPDESPVLDMVAKGFGSTTVKGMQHGKGHGVWEDGRWHLVITRPLERMGRWDPDLRPGESTDLAVAIWDGSNREVGARKSWSNWVAVELAE